MRLADRRDSARMTRYGQPVVDRYLNFLSSGSSKPSIELLRDTGVDMETPAPIQAAMDEFDHLLDELETLFQSQNRSPREEMTVIPATSLCVTVSL